MTADARKAEAVMQEVRACFNRLKALGDRLHRDLGITAAMRAVMETINEDGKKTVARIARTKCVTRQHIQVLVNSLVEAGLVTTRPNPADKRSPLIALNKDGKAAFARMRQREKVVVAEMVHALAACDLEATYVTLAALHAYLDNKLEKGESDA